ncbi:MAG TPA: sulfotransferase [Solirubrobacteraceae bacterium]|jgi:hypothetical protein|nr:sulfotransferase [Solirubrobacteraceae bacterium]
MVPAQSTSARSVCVLGFGRSGTSLTTRLLNLLGVTLGAAEDLLEPGEGDNPRGYWEPRWMVELNDEILDKLGTAWWRPFPVGPGWERSEELRELRERARGLLEEKFAGAGLWGVKDPRTTLTLPFWKDLLPDARYVICVRNPADAISSVQRRPDPQLPIGAWGELWLEYTARALSETEGARREVVFYEDLFTEPREQLAALARLLDLPEPDEQSLCEPLGAIERDLRHHATSPRELAATWGIPPAARALFLSLRAARESGGPDTAAAVERVAPELWWERRTLNDLDRAFAESQRNNANLEEERGRLREEHVRLTEALAGEREEAARLREHHEHERARLSTELERERHALEVSRGGHEETRATLASLEERLASRERLLGAVWASASWRLTAPLRAAERVARPGRASAREAHGGLVMGARERSLLVGMSVGQVWWFGLILCTLIAATDAFMTHVVLIAFLALGPLCGMLTARWTLTATVGAWALLLAVLLGVPDQIWGTRAQLVDVSTVASVAIASTLAALLIERLRGRGARY